MPDRSRFRSGKVAVLVVVLGILSSKTAADATDRVAASQPVRRTFNNAPFRYRMKLLREEDAYRVYRLTYPSPMVTQVKQNNTIPADYYLPLDMKLGDMELGKPAPKRPAVICLHILDGNFELVGMLCSALASRGVPAVAFKLPYYGQRALPGGPAAMLNDPKRFLSALPQAGLDVRRTVDLLASRPESVGGDSRRRFAGNRFAGKQGLGRRRESPPTNDRNR